MRNALGTPSNRRPPVTMVVMMATWAASPMKYRVNSWVEFSSTRSTRGT